MENSILKITICLLMPTLASCQNAEPQSQPEQTVFISKIFHKGNLTVQYLYGDDYVLDKIENYAPDGSLRSSREITLNDQGRVAEILITDYRLDRQSKLVQAYENGKKISSAYFTDLGSGFEQDSKDSYAYTNAHTVIIKIDRFGVTQSADDKTHVFTLDDNGNALEQHTNLVNNARFSFSVIKTFDEHISPDYLVERNIPGYHAYPVGKNNKLNHKRLNNDGNEIPSFTKSYRYKYDVDGYPLKRISIIPNGTESVVATFEYLHKE